MDMSWAWAPTARIIARYVLGGLFGAAVSDAVIGDPDLMTFLTMAVSGVGSYAVERVYRYAKARGWAT